MANTAFRAAPVYIKTKKIAEIQDSKWDIDSGDQPQVGIDEYLGHSDGVTMTTCEFTTITPVAGTSVNLLDLILNKQDVTVGKLVDGKMQQFTGRIEKYGQASESKNGTVKGTFRFAGGKPTAV